MFYVSKKIVIQSSKANLCGILKIILMKQKEKKSVGPSGYSIIEDCVHLYYLVYHRNNTLLRRGEVLVGYLVVLHGSIFIAIIYS